MAKTLVTGCNGFVARYLIDRLVTSGDEVLGIDREPQPQPHLSVSYQPLDVTDRDACAELVGKTNPKAIFHLAAVANPRTARKDPLASFDVNVGGTLNIVHAAARVPKVRVLVVGSSEQYGTAGTIRISEKTPFAPRNVYGATKAAAESLSSQFAFQWGLDVRFTRSFNHSGCGQVDSYVLSSFSRQCAEIMLGKREPVIRTGNLKVVRDFLDVRDVVRAYVDIVEHGKPHQAYNVCSGQPRVLRDLLEDMINGTGLSIEVEVDPARVRPDDPPQIVGDNSKLMTETSWYPECDISETVVQMLHFWKRRLAKERAEGQAK